MNDVWWEKVYVLLKEAMDNQLENERQSGDIEIKYLFLITIQLMSPGITDRLTRPPVA